MLGFLPKHIPMPFQLSLHIGRLCRLSGFVRFHEARFSKLAFQNIFQALRPPLLCSSEKFVKFGCLMPLSFRQLTTSRNRCWQCNAIVTERDLVCMICGSVQEPKPNLNNFEIFKEAQQFDIDTKVLSIKHRRLQSLLHPDKFALRPEKEKQYSQEQSSRVNRAYQTLSHPVERGLYLLELHGKPLLEGDITMSDEFLEEILETNDTLMHSTSAAEVEAIRNSNEARLEVLYAELSQAFKESNIHCAKEVLAKLKYFVSIDKQVRKMEDELGILRDW